MNPPLERVVGGFHPDAEARHSKLVGGESGLRRMPTLRPTRWGIRPCRPLRRTQGKLGRPGREEIQNCRPEGRRCQGARGPPPGTVCLLPPIYKKYRLERRRKFHAGRGQNEQDIKNQAGAGSALENTGRATGCPSVNAHFRQKVYELRCNWGAAMMAAIGKMGVGQFGTVEASLPPPNVGKKPLL